jgi:hypothetical protein
MKCPLNFTALNISKFGLETAIHKLKADDFQTNQVKLFRLELAGFNPCNIETLERLHLKKLLASIEQIFINIQVFKSLFPLVVCSLLNLLS